MTLNDINSKVNLPSVVRGELNGYQFIKIPVFGWFAFNSNRSEILALYDKATPEPDTSIYKKFSLNEPEHQEFKFTYSEHVDNRFRNNFNDYMNWKRFWNLSRIEANRGGKYFIDGKYHPLVDLINEKGYPHMLKAGIGLINDTVLSDSSVRELNLPSKLHNKLLIPSFCTPKHACSLEVASLDSMNVKKCIWTNGERGWYGNLGGMVVNNFEETLTLGGFTWDKKCDYWLDWVVDVSEKLNIQECLRIWAEAKNARFNKSPLDRILESDGKEHIVDYIATLSYSQINELEAKFEIPLLNTWKNLQYKEVTLNGFRVVKKNDVYLIGKNNAANEEFTNFTMDISKFIKRGESFFRLGHFNYKDSSIPFEFPESTFSSSKRLFDAIHAFFLKSGMPIPVITSNYKFILLDVVNRFSPDIPLEVMD